MKLRVLMVGTSNCTVCKSLQPEAESYCKSRGIPFEYKTTSELTPEEFKILRGNVSRVGSHAPMILVFSDEELINASAGEDSVKNMISFFDEGIQISFLNKEGIQIP